MAVCKHDVSTKVLPCTFKNMAARYLPSSPKFAPGNGAQSNYKLILLLLGAAASAFFTDIVQIWYKFDIHCCARYEVYLYPIKSSHNTACNHDFLYRYGQII